MYTKTDALQATQDMRRWVFVCALIFALCLGAVSVGVALRSRLIATGGGILFAFFGYFLLDNCLMPRVRYLKQLREIETGLTRELRCRFVSLGDAPRMVNGVWCYDFLCKVGEEEQDERLFRLDAKKELPDFAPGDELTVHSQDNFVTAIERIDS